MVLVHGDAPGIEKAGAAMGRGKEREAGALRARLGHPRQGRALPPQRGNPQAPPRPAHRLPRLRHHRQPRRRGPEGGNPHRPALAGPGPLRRPALPSACARPPADSAQSQGPPRRREERRDPHRPRDPLGQPLQDRRARLPRGGHRPLPQGPVETHALRRRSPRRSRGPQRQGPGLRRRRVPRRGSRPRRDLCRRQDRQESHAPSLPFRE